MTEMEIRVMNAIETARVKWERERPAYTPLNMMPTTILTRAAMEAMREPTDEMIDAAKAPGVPPILVKAIYQAMIDAASPDDEPA